MATRPGALAGARILGERFVHSQRPQNPEGRMPLLDHLRELRNRVVKMALALAAGMTAGFVFFGQAWRVIERPLCSAGSPVARWLGRAACGTCAPPGVRAGRPAVMVVGVVAFRSIAVSPLLVGRDRA